jgi:DNA-binding winged helix-turn-helix (wHTH) protein/tetratricopeptide (TPR) repeat protein
LDVANAQAWQGERLLKLTPKAFAVLYYLSERPGQLVTKDELMQRVWAETVVTDGALAASIRELRRALTDDAHQPQYIETVHRRGYRFRGPGVSSQQSVVSSLEAENQKKRTQFFSPPPSPQHPTPLLVGREAELTYLHHLSLKALQGERQLVFVTGEAGIGKTTLVEAFLAGLRHWELGSGASPPQLLDPKSTIPRPRAWVAVGRCIEHYGAGEAYLPVLEALGRLCRVPDGERLITLLNQHAPTWLVQMPALLSPTDYEALQRKTQGATRERMLRELAEALEMITAEHPLILVLEDLHWSDPSTLGLLSIIARRTESARLLILGTYRPVDVIVREHPLQTVKHELQLHGLCQELALELLSETAIAKYLEERFGLPSPLQGESNTSGTSTGEGNAYVSWQRLAQVIHQRTEGNPLFLVAMVEDLITSGVLVQTDTGWKVQENGDTEGRIPDSIRQLVTLQSHRLSSDTQQTLEAASIAGMEFSAAAVAAALGTETVETERRCEQLVMRQQFLRRLGVEEWPDGTLAARYSFLHALYQQFWHEQVSPTQLQHCHLRIGERKERAYGDRTREIAAELAMHFERGRDYRKAVQYLQQAGENATHRSAYQEATSYLTKGLELLRFLADTPERTQLELMLQITLSIPLSVTRGYATSELEKIFARARELSQQVGETRQLFSILHGAAVFYVGRAALHVARDLCEQLFILAQKIRDTLVLLESRFAMAATLLLRGEFGEAQEHAEQGIMLYDRYRSKRSPWQAHRCGVGCLNCVALVQWLLGYPDQALRRTQEALSLAQEMAAPFTLAEALSYAARFHQILRERQAVKEQAATLITLCTEQGFPLWHAEGTIVQGWVLAEQGRREKVLSIYTKDWPPTGPQEQNCGSLIFLPCWRRRMVR